ncbi:MAG: hypothetical protein AAF433_13600 [Bacteroidota bacterium]
MKMILISLLALASFSAPEEHDVAMAVFRLSVDDAGLSLQINFDREDYCKTSDLSLEAVNRVQLQTYLEQTTNWVINGKKQALIVEEVTAEREHFKATCRFPRVEGAVQQLLLQNEFMLGVDQQSNVIMLDLNGASRGFRMHQGRREIKVDY